MTRGDRLSLRTILLFGVLILPLMQTVWMWASLWAYPYDWNPGEGDNIFYAWQIGHGQSPYGDYDQYPMTGNCYPPFYHALCAPWVMAFGRHIIIGRLVSWLAMVATSVCIWILARRHGASRRAALIAAILYVICPSARRWAALARVDSVMTALGLTSFALLTANRPSRSQAILGALIGVAAIFTKPYAALFLLAGLIMMALRDRKLAIMAAGTAALAGFSILGLLQTWSHGWFWRNVISANATDFSWSLLATRELAFVLQYAVLIMLAFAALARRDGQPRATMVATLITGGAISLFMGKLGGTDNYLLPLAAALALAAGPAFDATWPFKRTWISVCAMGVQIAIWATLSACESPTSADRLAMDQIRLDLSEIQGEVLVERNASLQSLAGKDIIWEPSILLYLYHAGKWNPKLIADDLCGGRFIGVLTSGVLVGPLADVIKDKFVLVKSYRINHLDGELTYQLLLRRTKPRW